MSNPILEPTKLSPEAVISQLRTMKSQIEEVEPLTQEQRKLIKNRLRTHSKIVVEASINVIGVMDNVSQAIGQPIADIRQLQDDAIRWKAVAEEARAFLKGIEGANLVRSTHHALRHAGVLDRDTARQGPGESGARAACRGSQTAEKRLAS
jgi:hypothetical protein